MKIATTRFFARAMLCTIVVMCIFITVFAADVGTGEDAIITQSYLEQIFYPKIKDYIDIKTANASTPQGTLTPGTTAVPNTASDASLFRLVGVSKGSTVICGEGTELLLRSGTAKLIATNLGGISNLTNGTDLPNNTSMPLNNHLMIPRGDGRGFIASTDLLVLIKGIYLIK